MAEWAGLENRSAGNRTVGSNPTLSATQSPISGPSSDRSAGDADFSGVSGAWLLIMHRRNDADVLPPYNWAAYLGFFYEAVGELGWRGNGFRTKTY